MNDIVNMNAVPSEISTPSISGSCFLIELNISSWAGRKLDKKQSTEVAVRNNAASGMANVHKKLLGDCAELIAVQKFAANARNEHYSMTKPWSNSGLAILPTRWYDKYVHRMTGLQGEYNTLVNTFFDAYLWATSQAQIKLGDMFDANDYPTVDSLRNKFRFQINPMPMPEAGDFRVDLGNEAKEMLTSHYKDFYSNQIGNMMSGVWTQLYDALSKMSERLDYTNDSNKKIFRDSLVSNVTDMIDMLDAFNMTGDTQMTAMKQRLESTMLGITPDALREDDYLRVETKRAVDQMMKALPSLDL